MIVSKIVQLDLAISETANDDVARYRFRDERRARSMRVCLDHLRLINWMHSLEIMRLTRVQRSVGQSQTLITLAAPPTHSIPLCLHHVEINLL